MAVLWVGQKAVAMVALKVVEKANYWVAWRVALLVASRAVAMAC